MATRSAIARPTDLGWAGVYHHYDGYPSGLGQTLWSLYHGHFGRDVDRMTAYLIDDHPAGWSTINDADFTREPGFVEFPRTDNRPRCYCHGDRHEDPAPIVCGCPVGQNEDCDPIFIEWAYVLSARGMEVWKSETDSTARAETRHRRVAIVEWSGPEPDWDDVEADACEEV